MEYDVRLTTYTATTTVLLLIYRSTRVSWNPSLELEDFVAAEFYCLRALADGK